MRNASPRNGSVISNTPDPRPCIGFAISAIPPSAAIVKAAKQIDRAPWGNVSNSLSAALIHETGRVVRVIELSATAFPYPPMLSYVTTHVKRTSPCTQFFCIRNSAELRPAWTAEGGCPYANPGRGKPRRHTCKGRRGKPRLYGRFIWGLLRTSLPALLQLCEHLPCDFLERFEHAYALECYRLHYRLVFLAELSRERVHRQHVRQVALVQLQDVGNLVEVVAVFFQVGHQVVERFDVGVHALLLGIGHEHDAVHSSQNQLAAGVVKDLSRNRVEVNARFEAPHRAQIERQEIEEKGAIGLGGERDHLALLLFGCFLEDELQIRRLAAQPGAVVDDLTVDLTCCEVDETQKVSSETPSKRVSQTTPSTREPSRHYPPALQYRLLLVFIPHRKALAQVTHVTNPPRAQMVSGSTLYRAVGRG